jgi:hypothetical protein
MRNGRPTTDGLPRSRAELVRPVAKTARDGRNHPSETRISITAAADRPAGYFDVVRVFDTNRTIPAITDVVVSADSDYVDFDSSLLSFSGDYVDVHRVGERTRSADFVGLACQRNPACSRVKSVANARERSRACSEPDQHTNTSR